MPTYINHECPAFWYMLHIHYYYCYFFAYVVVPTEMNIVGKVCFEVVLLYQACVLKGWYFLGLEV